MAVHEWDWFRREELIGQISDIRVQNLQEAFSPSIHTCTCFFTHTSHAVSWSRSWSPPVCLSATSPAEQAGGWDRSAALCAVTARCLLRTKVERENVQKRTFTRWVNLHLEKCNPPLEVNDLFVDIRDGKILMALLEVLSGRELVKLVSIDAAEIADGNPSLVLGLIWNIILFFQIKELTGNLRTSPSSSLSPASGGTDSDSSFPPTPTAERNAVLSMRDQRKTIRALLAWVQRKTRKYGVAVQDFAGSWRSGLAFLAVIKAIDPSLVDMKQALEDSMRDNLERAFRVAQDALHIPRLLEPEDIMVDNPDEQSIVTYVAQFLERFPDLEAEDLVDSDDEAPIEATFVRIRETPSEQESKILLLPEDRESSFTLSHPPPSKVFVGDWPEPAEDGGAPQDTASFMHQLLEQMLQETPGRSVSLNEPSPESSILASRKENRRANSLPGKKTVHFQADAFQDAPCGKEQPEATPSPETPGEISSETPEGQSCGGRPCLGSRSWNGALDGSAVPVEEGPPPSSPEEENIAVAECLELRVKLLVGSLATDDPFEAVPLKASRFSSDLTDYASTSHAFCKGPPPEDRRPPGPPEVQQRQPGPLGKRKSKSAHRKDDSDEPQLKAGRRGPGPEEEETHVFERTRCKSPRLLAEEDREAAGPPGSEPPSQPPSTSVSLETLGSRSQEGLSFLPSPPLSKTAVLPLDPFYYPHYGLPLTTLLETYAEAIEDPRQDELDPEGPDGFLSEAGSREEKGEEEDEEEEEGEQEEEEKQEPRDAPKEYPQASDPESPLAPGAGGPEPASDATPPQDHPQETDPGENHQSQGPSSPLGEKATEGSTSSKKKEKRKHVDHVGSSIFIVPAAVCSSDELEDDPGEHKVPSRTSHSDSSIYTRRLPNRALESEGQGLWGGGAALGPEPPGRVSGAAGASGRALLHALPLAPGVLSAAVPAAGGQRAVKAPPPPGGPHLPLLPVLDPAELGGPQRN
ncbi:calmin isoform X3 [Erinaceus europaeus]|uniref:Calmin isoform X3 n=2 Tax=Erinaceus europaeus TaxID=9365 RepID=A0ABM3WK95_ERIEU|nr:calmin isoform X3 [Erinaceus europaeus]